MAYNTQVYVEVIQQTITVRMQPSEPAELEIDPAAHFSQVAL